MTSDIVLDSCVLAKLILPEPDSHLAATILENAISNGSVGVGLRFAAVEVANIVWKQCHRRLLNAFDAQGRLEGLYELPIRWIDSDFDLSGALGMALKYDIAVYDALFVASVESLGCSGVTSDQKLHRKVCADFPQIQLLS